MSSLPPELEPWIAELAPRLGLTDYDVPTRAVLDIARDVAHSAVRPGAPVSTFMVGLALGRGDLSSPEAGVEAVGEALAAWEQRGQGDERGDDTSGGDASTGDAGTGDASTDDASTDDADTDDAGTDGDAADSTVTDGVNADADTDARGADEADAAGIVGDLNGGSA